MLSANSGIGKELSTYAAAKGAKLYMLCRSKDRAEKAREEVVKLTSNEDVEIMLVSTTTKYTTRYNESTLFLRMSLIIGEKWSIFLFPG